MLSVDNLRVSFGSVIAVDGASVEVAPGAVRGIVGPNGSGKTTFLNGLSGLVPSSGEIRVDGVDVRRSPVHHRNRWFGRTFQTPRLHPDLTALENVIVATSSRASASFTSTLLLRPRVHRQERAAVDRAVEMLALVGVPERFFEMAGSRLPLAVSRGVEIARALVSGAPVLMLDEPCAGLNDNETAELAAALHRIRSPQRTILVIEHKVDFIDSVADEVTVLESGRVIATEVPEKIWRLPRVVEAYLGGVLNAESQ